MRLLWSAVASFALSALLALPVRAAPPPIHPECAKQSDKISCSCALNNGGYMKYDARGRPRWQSKRHKNDPVNSGFVQCMKENGRG